MVYGLLQAVVSACAKPNTRQNSPPATQEEAGQVQRVVVSTLVGCEPEQGTGDRAGSKDEVYEERPPPRGVRGKDAAEEETQCAAGAGDGAVDPEGPTALLRIGEGGGQEREHRGGKQGPERALDGPGDDEHRRN